MVLPQKVFLLLNSVEELIDQLDELSTTLRPEFKSLFQNFFIPQCYSFPVVNNFEHLLQYAFIRKLLTCLRHSNTGTVASFNTSAPGILSIRPRLLQNVNEHTAHLIVISHHCLRTSHPNISSTDSLPTAEDFKTLSLIK